MSTPEAPPTPAWYVTGQEVNDYVGKSTSRPGDNGVFEAAVAEEANALVAAFIGECKVPGVVARRAALEVASELHHRRNAPNGIAQFATPDVAPVRVARDPMLGAYPLLARYVSGGFA